MKFLSLAFLFILSSCDFSSNVHKEILDAQALLKELNYAEAAKTYNRISKKIPPSTLKSKVDFQLGDIYSLYLNQQGNAVKVYEKLIQETTDPRWKIKAQEKLGEIHFSFYRNYNESISYYKELYNFFPKLENQDFYHLRLGESYLKNKNYSKAKEAFSTMMKDKNQQYRSRAFYFLGMIHFYEKDWQKAVDYWIEYLRRETKKDELIKTKYLMANAYETMEELQKAYDIYYSLLGEYPNPQVIKDRLKSLYARRKARNR